MRLLISLLWLGIYSKFSKLLKNYQNMSKKNQKVFTKVLIICMLPMLHIAFQVGIGFLTYSLEAWTMDSNGSYFFPSKKQQVESFRFQQYCVKVCHVSALSRTYKCSFDNLKLLWDTFEASLKFVQLAFRISK